MSILDRYQNFNSWVDLRYKDEVEKSLIVIKGYSTIVVNLRTVLRLQSEYLTVYRKQQKLECKEHVWTGVKPYLLEQFILVKMYKIRMNI